MMLNKFSPQNFISSIIVFLLLAGMAFGQALPRPISTPDSKVDATRQVPPTEMPNDPPPVAPNFEAPTRPLPSPERVGIDLNNQLLLSLDDAIELALKNNNDIETSRTQVKLAEYNLTINRASYDPKFVSEDYYESATSPVASTIGGSTTGALTQRRLFNSAGISGLSPYRGGSYSATLNSTLLTSSSTNATLNPQYPLSLSFTYTQPLYRGKGFDLVRRNLEIAKKNLTLTDSQFRQKAIDVITGVEQGYWDLVYSLRNLQVQIDAVKQAKLQLESNLRLVNKGVVAPIDTVAATAQITTFEQNVYSAQEAVTRAENVLKTLMLAERTDQIWSRPLIPISPISLESPRIGLEVAIDEALKNRPEIEQYQVNSEINAIDNRYLKEQARPQIDLVGTYTMQGLAGTNTGIRSVPQNLIGGYVNSLGNLVQQDYPTYRVGVSISIPWKNRVAETNLGINQVQSDLIKNQRDQAEQIIEAQVRNALQTLRSAEARLNSAVAARGSAEQLFDSEQRQFKGGIATLYLVLQRQTELLAARGRELQAQTDLNKAIAEFERSIGKTLTVKKIVISENKDLKLNKSIK